MPTQKTRIGDGTTAPPDLLEDDLGLTEDMVPRVDDPSGFVASTPVQEVAGRRMRPMPDTELKRAHDMQAGPNVPVFGPSSFGQNNSQEQQKQTEDPEITAARARRAQSPDNPLRQTAEQMMPDFLKDAQVPTQPIRTPTAEPKPTTQERLTTPSTNFSSVAAALEHLIAEEEDARSRGDYVAADQAKRMAEKIAADVEFERVVRPKQEHPALQKLKQNLGLVVIKPASIEWAGSKWMFAPTNAKLDRWVFRMMENDGTNLNALLIASSLIGIDDVPLYDVLGLALETDYHINEKNPDGTIRAHHTTTVKLYRKFCDCGTEVEIKTDKCPICRKLHDPFDIPTELRLKCAEMFLEFLEDDFGPYEDLEDLVAAKEEVIKDRRFNKEQLYPLVISSKKQKETTT